MSTSSSQHTLLVLRTAQAARQLLRHHAAALADSNVRCVVVPQADLGASAEEEGDLDNADTGTPPRAVVHVPSLATTVVWGGSPPGGESASVALTLLCIDELAVSSAIYQQTVTPGP